jgi:leader peptidase (prepilin peptidase)/N-methyltransferase
MLAVPAITTAHSVVAFSALLAAIAAPVFLAGTMSWLVLLATLGLGATLISLAAIDLATFRLPNTLTLALTAAGLALAPFITSAPLWWRPLSALAGFLMLAAVAEGYRRLRGRQGMGLGDAKLLAAAGAWLGLEALPSVLLWATGLAIAGVLAASLAGAKLGAASRIPFGPALALGFWLVWLYGPL